MSSQLICLALMLCAVHSASGLYFHMAGTDRKCFLRQLADETVAIVIYKVELYDSLTNRLMSPSPGIGLHVEVRDSENKVVLSRVYNPQGRLAFTSHLPGEHVICIKPSGTVWFTRQQLRVHLDIRVGAQAIDYANMKLKEKLPMEELRIRQLLEQIAKEQNYQRYREQHFRNTNKSTNSLVLEWSLLQAVVLICLTLLQMLHLNSLKEPLVADETLSIEGSAPCIQQSQIKHFAVPNAQFMLSDTKDTVILKATAAIQIGEEIWISDLDDFQLERSRKNSIFDCQCQQCRAESISDMISEEENEDRADSVN